MSDYQFTKNWFGWGPQIWPEIIKFLPERKNFLEIGSFEGRSTVWTIENMMENGGEIYCIDTWEGGEEHTSEDMDGTELRFEHNIQTVRKAFPERRVVKLKGLSIQWVPSLICEKLSFDFIYIDGSHVAKDVLTDACMAWPLLKKDGMMAFDDYLWKPPKFTLTQRPKIAIDSFVNIFEDEIAMVHNGYQLIIRKLK
jgi:predicted O-methyltransferase YrrM